MMAANTLPVSTTNNAYGWNKGQCEYLRNQAKTKFSQIRGSWLDCGRWAYPHRIQWMISQTPGERNNQLIVDPTHVISLRSYVAGFLEGNTSASRPWYRVDGDNPDASTNPANKKWLELYTKRTLSCLSTSNFYHAAGQFYYDFGVFNTGSYFIDEIHGKLFFHNLIPGSYFVINNGYNEAVVLVRELSLTVKALVDTFGTRKKSGSRDWSNFSSRVQKMYDQGNYTQMIDIVQVVKENEHFDPEKPQMLLNKRWISLTYELGGAGGQYYQDGQEFGFSQVDPLERETGVFLKISASKRKPFIVGKSETNGNFEYGQKGPTLDSLGLIKSLQKKAIGKDQALEHMLKPALQGPASVRKSYITSASNSYIPLDPTALSNKGLRPIFEMNPAVGEITRDVEDMRRMVGQLYYSDYLLYLSRNPKTRTAAETNAVVQEQQLVIGPVLQSMNWTHNLPVVEFVMDFVLWEDPYLAQNPPPASLAGQFLKTEFISVFAQAQKAADLPSVERYLSMIEQVGQLPGGVKIWDKLNLDKLADIYEDRLWLPSGLNNPQAMVDAMRQQALAQQQQQQALHQTIPALAGAAKDVGMKMGNQNQ